MRLVIIGGHITPAYSFAEVARSHHDSIVLIGSSGVTSQEYKELIQLECEYRSIFPVKLDRYHRIISLLKLPLIIIPFIQSLKYLSVFKPDGVISFGSFNAVPVCFAAYVKHIPVMIHEQTRTAGLANRIIGHFAARCAISYSESTRYFPTSKTLLTGNVLRSGIWNPPRHFSMNVPSTKPILYITGGNQGSYIINQVVRALLPILSVKYQIIWQYGKQRIQPDSIRETIIAQSWFSVTDTSWLLHHAHIIVTRGGANTIAEIMVAGIPSVIIPLPQASQDEQTRNALTITSKGAGILIKQLDLSSVNLASSLIEIESHYDNFLSHAKMLTRLQDSNAAGKLYREMIKVIESV